MQRFYRSANSLSLYRLISKLLIWGERPSFKISNEISINFIRISLLQIEQNDGPLTGDGVYLRWQKYTSQWPLNICKYTYANTYVRWPRSLWSSPVYNAFHEEISRSAFDNKIGELNRSRWSRSMEAQIEPDLNGHHFNKLYTGQKWPNIETGDGEWREFSIAIEVRRARPELKMAEHCLRSNAARTMGIH